MVGKFTLRRKKKPDPEKLERFIVLLEKALEEVENEKRYLFLWKLDVVENMVEPELLELLEYAKKGEVKYDKRRRRLQSTHYMTDTITDLYSTSLGRSISELQKAYNEL